MKVSTGVLLTGAALVSIFCSIPTYARDHSELNGTWALVAAKSDFAGQAVVQTGTVTIADREGIIIVSRSFVYAGAAETFFYRDVTDSEHGDTFHDGKDLKSRTNWDHDVLKVTTTRSGVVTVESYTLADDGTLMDTVVSPGHAPITLLFQRR